jgi:hypothetical protein
MAPAIQGSVMRVAEANSPTTSPGRSRGGLTSDSGSGSGGAVGGGTGGGVGAAVAPQAAALALVRRGPHGAARQCQRAGHQGQRLAPRRPHARAGQKNL